MMHKKTQKIMIYLMLISMLVTTLLAGASMFGKKDDMFVLFLLFIYDKINHLEIEMVYFV